MLFIDSHVHIQNCFNLKEYFNNTFRNFSYFNRKSGSSGEWLGVLFFTEVIELDFFNQLKAGNNSSGIFDDIFISRTNEENSLLLSNKKGEKIIAVAGKQIITQNNIEVLAIGTTKKFENNRSLLETINNINLSGAIAVLPWGVGKWVSRRKIMIKNFIEENNQLDFFLGDNSGRLNIWPKPKLFNLAKKYNKFILPGTDALDITSEVDKTGSYGFYLNSEISLDFPYRDLKKLLTEFDKQPSFFGKLETPFRFFVNQLQMQLKKHSK